MSVGRWVRVAEARIVPPGTGRTVVAEGRRIALFNEDGTFRAIDDTCPHRGASLGEGLFVEGRVICPWHAWIFDVNTGVCPDAPETRVARYEARAAGDSVEIEIPEE
jgi:nitrite reductase (NADH) small subunit